MSGVNKVLIIGRLGQEPDLKTTSGGKSVCTLNLATSEKWKDKSGNSHERTEWHRVVIWGKQAENAAKYLEKGRQVYVEGKLQTRSWEKDGVRRYTTEILASMVQYLGGGSGSSASRNDNMEEEDFSGEDSREELEEDFGFDDGFGEDFDVDEEFDLNDD